MVDLPSHRLKLDRAAHHLRTLERAERGEEPEAYVLTDEPDPDGSGHTIHVETINAGILGAVIGDCVHNLRCALDHLALQLAIAYTHPLPAGYEEGSEFPIFWERPMRPDEESKRIGCIDPRAQAAIKTLQPHHRGQHYRDDPLWQLHELDRIDKHRTIHPIQLRNSGVGVSGVNVEVHGLEVMGKGDEMKAGTPIAVYSAAPLDPKSEMHMNLRAKTQIAFEQRSPFPNLPVVSVLVRIREHLEQQVVTPLEKYL